MVTQMPSLKGNTAEERWSWWGEAEGPSKCALPASDIKGQVPELETVLDTDEY